MKGKKRRFNFSVALQVIKESAELALSWVKTHAYDLGITNKRALDPLRIPDATMDLHLHLPAGAQKKDGPSAGIAMVRSLLECGVGAKRRGVGTDLCDRIPLDGKVCPAYDCHDWRGAQIIPPPPPLKRAEQS